MDAADSLAVTVFAEIIAIDQMVRAVMAGALPRGMELSQFSVLNHLAHVGGEKTPAQLARAFHLTRGAMTNTIGKLEWAGWVHIRPDWDDARQKLVSISPAGLAARNAAVAAITPLIRDIVAQVGQDRVGRALPVLRELRLRLSGAE